MKQDYVNILHNIQQNSKTEEIPIHRRVLVIDGLNLFFRNFSALNMINPNGIHIGGLGGFFRSLGFLINNLEPSEVYIVFDGQNSTSNRKDIIPEYKEGRNVSRLTNFSIFNDKSEEEESQITQIVRIIQYLKTLPVKVLALDRAEADDIIAYLSQTLVNSETDKIIIVSADNDFIQLINSNTILYSPVKKIFLTEGVVFDSYKVLPKNFILYKTLLGDSSDNLKGIKGLGAKGIIKKFPELGEKIMSLDDIFEISRVKFKDNIVYSRIIQNENLLRKKHSIMDLSNPILDEGDKLYIENTLPIIPLPYNPELFIEMYEQDGLGRLINNVEYWIQNTFKNLIN